MYELIRVTPRFYYVDCPAKIGVYKISQREVCLIDSGNNRSAATKVLRVLEENGFFVSAIFNTHAHADHTGGNRHIQQKTGCKIYASAEELQGILHPIREPISLFGARPMAELRHGFLLAEESRAEPLSDAVMPEGLSVLSLPGHTAGMVGFLSEDGAVYLADALASETTLEKYGIPYVYDPAVYLETLKKIEKMEGKVFVPAHAATVEDIAPLARRNIESTEALMECILSLTAAPIGFDLLLKKIFDRYALSMTVQQYALVGSTVRSYLSCLADMGKISVFCQENALLWAKK